MQKTIVRGDSATHASVVSAAKHGIWMCDSFDHNESTGWSNAKVGKYKMGH